MPSWHDDLTEEEAARVGRWTVRFAVMLAVVAILLLTAALDMGISNAAAGVLLAVGAGA